MDLSAQDGMETSGCLTVVLAYFLVADGVFREHLLCVRQCAG